MTSASLSSSDKTYWTRNDKRNYYIKDYLASIRLTFDQDGTVVNAQDYCSYGEIFRSIPTTYSNKYKFTEKERDTETGYDYFGARFYDSRLGRWLSVDPLADKYPGWSPYNYCLNNPLKYVDPDGRFAVEGNRFISTKSFISSYLVWKTTGVSPNGDNLFPSQMGSTISGYAFDWAIDKLPRTVGLSKSALDIIIGGTEFIDKQLHIIGGIMTRSINRFLFLLTLLLWGGCSNSSENDVVIKYVMKLEKDAMGDNSGEVNDYSVSEIISAEWLKSKVYIIKTNPYVSHSNKFMIAIDTLGNIIEIYNPYSETDFSKSLNQIMNHWLFLKKKDIQTLLQIHQAYYTSVYGSSNIFVSDREYPDTLKTFLQPPHFQKDTEKIVAGFNFIIKTNRGDYNVYRDSIIVDRSGLKVYQKNLTNNKVLIF
jgi:RHS repeat-associated protein